MNVRIIDNGINRENIQRDMVRALAGNWGRVERDESVRIGLGRVDVQFLTGGDTISNESANQALALVVYDDGASDILALDSAATATASKTIKMAVLIGLQ